MMNEASSVRPSKITQSFIASELDNIVLKLWVPVLFVVQCLIPCENQNVCFQYGFIRTGSQPCYKIMYSVIL